ncbi:LysR substrate-binding domain-containing protein [Halopseudomonas pachastrellae]|nr:LysR substrate-binding domain-containing protein [Halopseudomonas pachastrellae]
MQDLNDLLCFARVVRYGGFAAAERATGERKSKLSKRVARLETDFGARLIERSTRSFRVTDIGRELYRECEVILQRLEASEALAMTARDEVRGTVRVAMSAGMLEYLGRTTLVDFMSRYPEVRLQLRLSSQRVDLINERIDVAFRVATRFDTDQSLAMRSLGVGARILAASPALLQRLGGAPETLDDLARFPTLSVGEMLERDRWEFANDVGETCDHHHVPHFSSGDLQLICEAAVAGRGWCCCLSISVRQKFAAVVWCISCRNGMRWRGRSTWSLPRHGACCPRCGPLLITVLKPWPSAGAVAADLTARPQVVVLHAERAQLRSSLRTSLA